MTKHGDGGPAFPLVGAYGDHQCPGASLRDYFAAKALPGAIQMIAAGQHQPCPDQQSGPAFVAFTAYEIADAMLRARASATGGE